MGHITSVDQTGSTLRGQLIRTLGLFFAVGYLLRPLLHQWLRNGKSSNLWFDESGQYLISQGLNHISQLSEPTGSLLKVLQENQLFNADPGGFSILLRIWTSVAGSSPTSLRACAFSSLVVLVLGSLFLVWNIWRSVFGLVVFATLFHQIVYGVSSVFYYSFEIRAYSASLALAVLTPMLAAVLIKHETVASNVVVAMICCLACTFRYEAILCTGAVVFSWYIVTRKRTKYFRFWPMVPGVVLIAFLSMLYLSMTRFQSPSGRPPAYVSNYMINSFKLSEMVDHLKNNLNIAPYSLRVAAILFGGTVLVLRRFDKSLQQSQLKFLIVFQFVVISLQFLLSALGRMPWWVGARWSINDVSYSVVAAVTLMIACNIQIVYLRDNLKLGSSNKQNRKLSMFSILGICTFAFVSLSAIQVNSQFSRTSPDLIASAPAFWEDNEKPLILSAGLLADFHYLIRFSGLYSELSSKIAEDKFLVWNQSRDHLPFPKSRTNLCSKPFRIATQGSWNSSVSATELSLLREIGQISDLVQLPPDNVSPGWNLFLFTPSATCLYSQTINRD